MKKFSALFVALLLLGAGSARAQRVDLNSLLDEAKGLIPITRANTAATGPWVDLQGYAGAMVVVQSGLMDASAQYIVLQDSVPGSAVAAIDSVDVGADSTTSSMAYRGRGRYIRVLLRASGGAGDSSWVSAVVLRSNARTR